MNNIEQIKKEQAEALKEAERENEMFKVIFTKLNLTEEEKENYCIHTYGSNVSFTLEADNIQEAIKRMETFDLLEIYMFKGSCTAFLPLDYVDSNKDKSNDDKYKAGKYIYKIDGLAQYAETRKLEGYIKIGKYIVEIQIKVAQDNEHRRNWRTVNHKGYTTVEDVRLHNEGNIFENSVRWYSSAEHPAPFTLFNKGEKL